ncbi:MAG: helix-turn-helix domain-containing protein [Chloroflexi bacterium]|nr:helix-turn-helix domain-containing protein [Chloroflexota bacterium]
MQAAEHLSVHPSTIRCWIDRGRLPAYRLGDKRIGVRAFDLARLVAPRPARLPHRGRTMQSSQMVIAPADEGGQTTGPASPGRTRAPQRRDCCQARNTHPRIVGAAQPVPR